MKQASSSVFPVRPLVRIPIDMRFIARLVMAGGRRGSWNERRCLPKVVPG